MCRGDEDHQRGIGKLKLYISVGFSEVRMFKLTTSNNSMLITVHLLPYRLNSLPTLSAVSCEFPVSDAYKITTLSIGMRSSIS
jgi:hypothetical protein